MDKPKVAACFPKQIELEAGKNYAYCTCGLSADGALCDGSHKGSGFTPDVFKAEESKTIWVCQCKHTGSAPNCDGSHKQFETEAEADS